MIGGKPLEPVRDAMLRDDEEAAIRESAAFLPEDAPWASDEEDHGLVRRGAGAIWAGAAIAVALLWVVAMLVLAWPVLLAGLAPIALAEFVAALCVPPALIALLYQLGQRTSRAEARRFGATARAMRAEAATLERVVATLSSRIEANRVALAEQTTQLMTLGERTAQKVEAAAAVANDQAQALESSARVLGETSAEAERRVEILLASLPRADQSLKGMVDRIDSAGLLANMRVGSLDAQLSALAERGREADRIAGGAAERLAAHIARMEATSEVAGARLEQVTGEMSSAVDTVLDRAAQAVDEARKGIAAQGEAILAMLGANQAALDRAGRDTTETLAERIAEIEQAIVRIGERLATEQGRGDALFEGLAEGTDQLDQALRTIHAGAGQRVASLAETVSALHGAVTAMDAALQAGDARARGAIGTTEELLTALDASARELDETLPAALNRLDARIATSREVVAEVRPDLLALVGAAETTHGAVAGIAAMVANQRQILTETQAALIETLASGSERAAALGQVVDETMATTRRFAEGAAPQLVEALVRVRETANAAADHAREALASIVPGAVRALEEGSGAALQRAMDDTVRRQLLELAETTEAAATAAARASERLSHQMLVLSGATAEVESRIEEGRAEREKSDSEGFARRVSLLVESLNSASIDIAKAFSAEVADSAWNAYLKGDRGVFTRRAVRLLEPSEARDVLRLYEQDDGFRDNVNRYIHDFEAMLRQILALREGSSLGVTLLSSDMGKLYVALAQGIERLRT